MGLHKALQLGCCALALLEGPVRFSFGQEQSVDVEALSSSSSEAALERVNSEVTSGGGARDETPRSAAGIRVRRRSTLGTADPIYRNGVPYYDEWTIRAGAQRLRLPAYAGWQGVNPSSEFYELQANSGKEGHHLAAALIDQRFVRASRSKYVNSLALVWVPQTHAFQDMTQASFDEYKGKLKEEIVERRKQLVKREDFLDFEDYIAFKFGEDEKVDEFVDGFMVRAAETESLVTYFATSEFLYQAARTEIRQPMIMTVTYALVQGKLLRFDFKRLFTSDEDVLSLIAFSQQFVADMRTLNGLSDYKPIGIRN